MERKPITVSALNRYLKYTFDHDKNLQSILLKAEISNFKRHSRGHLYMTLKDDASQISAVMFQSQANTLLFDPKEGSKVLVEGYVSIYETSGTYQVYIQKMTEDGIGDLFLQFEQLKKKLSEEGLFSEERKRKLPRFPKTIGVITSPTGAAVKDVIRVISSRYPLAKILVYPALVQGADAKDSIKKQIEQANRDQQCDVLIVGRGGGSIEDLWPFNEEVVARAIYSSKIPVISAVGHEVDFTIADFVADVRAATPSQAGELAVVDQKDLLRGVNLAITRMQAALLKELNMKRTLLERIQSAVVLSKPTRMLESKEVSLDRLLDKLTLLNPIKQIASEAQRLQTLQNKLGVAISHQLESVTQRFLRCADKLDMASPLNIMKKGYSLVKKDEEVITSVNKLHQGDTINVSFCDGSAVALVQQLRKDES